MGYHASQRIGSLNDAMVGCKSTKPLRSHWKVVKFLFSHIFSPSFRLKILVHGPPGGGSCISLSEWTQNVMLRPKHASLCHIDERSNAQRKFGGETKFGVNKRAKKYDRDGQLSLSEGKNYEGEKNEKEQ